ncbi:MAG: hypothetical protein Q9202_001711 [Teloschistes flavicans]
MKTRRTLSVDFPQPQPNSDALDSPNCRKGQDTSYAASASCPAGSVNASVRAFDRHAQPFPSSTSFQDVREHQTHLTLSTTPPQRPPSNRPPQRRSSPRSRGRSNRSPSPSPHGPSEMTEPPASTDSSDCLLTAHLDPPITKETLSELDLSRIVSDARLRHDVNYEHEIMFRPNTYGKRGEQKNQEGNRYFEALALEFSHYLSLRSSCSPSPSPSASTPDTAKRSTTTLSGAPRRLPRMITAVREIVKTLVPLVQWQTVEQQFDVDLRMQELERGIGDIAGLIEWLGKMLLDSCSPMRDSTVKDMVARTQRAITAQDAQELVHAIRDLFGVLETMKLDVANHQIRYLRFYLLDESIPYEQNHMLDRIASGWSVSHERRWFEAGYDSPKDHDSFVMFKESVIDMIVSSWEDFPKTFISDYERLHALQQEFKLHFYGTACGYTLTTTLHQLGWPREPPAWARIECMQRVWDVVAEPQESFILEARQDVVLEIVRVAFKVCNKTGIPDTDILSFAKSYLFEAVITRTPLHHMITDRLRNGLLDIVHSETAAIFNMTPLEILTRYDPNPSAPPSMIGQRAQDPSLLGSIARRATHILVLHWRVWAPILYNRADPADGPVKKPDVITAEKEMSERERVRPASTKEDGNTTRERTKHVILSERERPRSARIRSSSVGSTSSISTTCSD